MADKEKRPEKTGAWYDGLAGFAWQSGVLSRLGLNARFLPAELYADDIYVVSFPKSGNTWLRFLIGNALTGSQCDFSNIHKIVPAIYENRDECSRLARPRIMKSHLPFTPQMKRMIYMVRDGRDVAVSYYYHLLKKKKIAQGTSFDEYMQKFNRGLNSPRLGSWNSHVLSWLDRWPADHILVYYENLKKDTEAEFRRILDFIGLQMDEQAIASAISASDFKRMKALEQEQSGLYHDFRNTDLSIPFMRTGKSGSWREHFSKQNEKDFLLHQGEAMRRLKYIP